ncbi:MAG: hypothetical protein JNG88_12010 [Phycisphaerales bacterium]|nr:hypothetical protein [Phycisphaerales bacterium]
MIDPTLISLAGTAAFIAATHTLLGADHYIPFIAMSRAGRWSITRTLVITILCGVAHVLSSVVVGAIGIAAGAAIGRLDGHENAMGAIESTRGSIAGWLLLGFGIAYTAWGVREAIRSRPHSHWHAHADGTVHDHKHMHHAEHAHAHAEQTRSAQDAAPPKSMTPWVLFTIFIFGPCEPLIPLLMLPAAQHSPWGIVLVASVFGAVTIAMMLGMVLAGVLGINGLFKSGWKMERYTHALAGAALAGCGAFVVLGG